MVDVNEELKKEGEGGPVGEGVQSGRGVRSGEGSGQGGCERRIEVIVKMQKKIGGRGLSGGGGPIGGGGGSGWM